MNAKYTSVTVMRIVSNYHFVWVICPIVNKSLIFNIYCHAVFSHVLTRIHISIYIHMVYFHMAIIHLWQKHLRKCILLHITPYWAWNCQSSHLYSYSSCSSCATNPYLSGMLCSTWECVLLRVVAANISCLLTGAVVGHLGYTTFIHRIKKNFIFHS